MKLFSYLFLKSVALFKNIRTFVLLAAVNEPVLSQVKILTLDIMEKELIKALIAMRYALKDVMDQLPIEERFFNLDYAAQCDLESQELLLQAGVDPNDMPA